MSNISIQRNKPQFTHFIGIDPGAKGSIVVMRKDKPMMRYHRFAASTDHGIVNFLKLYSRVSTDDLLRSYCYIEDVRGYIGEGGDGTKRAGPANATRMFAFGKSYGTIIGILTALEISYSTTLPQEWLRHYGMKREKGESDSSWKRRLHALAKELYPSEIPDKFQLDLGDATLIAGYCRHQLSNND